MLPETQVERNAMTRPDSARTFLESEIEDLQPFDFVAVYPAGQPLHVVEAARGEDGPLEVRVPPRPMTVPPLGEDVHEKLRERGFASEEPTDPMQPWRRAVADAGEAASMLLELLVDVLGEKPEAKLDIAHGSHRLEHEARKKLEIARTRIEEILKEMLGREPEKDADGDYVLPVDDVHVTVAPRASADGQVVVRVFAICNVGVNVAPELGLFLARLNFGLMFGRFALDTERRSIWFDEALLGEQFREEELRFAVQVVAKTADQWDDPLKQMFGGATYQEVLSGRADEAAPTVKPGAGPGLYL